MRACSHMSNPTANDLEHLKRLGRYLLLVPRASLVFEWQSPAAQVHCFSDSDWAGDRVTRKSVSGGALFHGKHLLKCWSKQQAVIATSSAEAELYACSRACSEALGAQTLLYDLGKQCSVTVHMDSSSALSMAQRSGLGKAKHIAVQHLWMQELVKAKRLKLTKVPGDSNPSDLMTKALGSERIGYLMRLLGYDTAGFYAE